MLRRSQKKYSAAKVASALVLMVVALLLVGMKATHAQANNMSTTTTRLGNDGAPSTEVNLYESDCPKNLDDNGCEACVSAGCFWQPVDRFCGKDCMIMDTSCYGVAESWSAPCPDPNATKPTNSGGGR